jgi:hypothetical protein
MRTSPGSPRGSRSHARRSGRPTAANVSQPGRLKLESAPCVDINPPSPIRTRARGRGRRPARTGRLSQRQEPSSARTASVSRRCSGGGVAADHHWALPSRTGLDSFIRPSIRRPRSGRLRCSPDSLRATTDTLHVGYLTRTRTRHSSATFTRDAGREGFTHTGLQSELLPDRRALPDRDRARNRLRGHIPEAIARALVVV